MKSPISPRALPNRERQVYDRVGPWRQKLNRSKRSLMAGALVGAELLTVGLYVGFGIEARAHGCGYRPATVPRDS